MQTSGLGDDPRDVADLGDKRAKRPYDETLRPSRPRPGLQETTRKERSMKPERIQAKMKPERIQAKWSELREKLQAPEAETKMKPERIQEKLEELPGWRVGSEGSGLQRTSVLPSIEATAAFVNLVLELGAAIGFEPRILIEGQQVTVYVATGKEGQVTALDFNVAEAMELRPQWTEAKQQQSKD